MMKTRFILTLLALLAGILPVFAQDATETECENGATLIVHDLGETCVPADVERIVTIENSMTETVVTLGFQPVGVADLELYNNLVQLPATEAIDIGTRQEPNLETIATLEPDLIVAASWRVSDIYDELSAIAPTITFEGSSNLDMMTDYFTTIATALNREAEAQQILDDMHQYFEDAGAAVAEANIDPNFVLSLTWYADEAATFRLYTNNAFPVEILELVGFENVWDGEENPNGFNVVGIEALGDVETSNFFFITDEGSESFYDDSPLWNTLPFVADGTTYRLSDNLWLYGGPISAQRVVGAVLDALGISTINCEAGFRLYQNELLWDGTSEGVCIPEDAQRVVIANHPTYLLDNVLALGVEPVGIAVYLDRFAVSPYLADQVDGVTHVGSFREPNLEVILELEPDLILSTTFREDYYDQLSAIAPTVLLEWDQISWKDFLLATGDAVNRLDEAQILLDDYEARVATIADILAESGELPEISVVRLRPDNIRYYVESSLVGRVLQDLRLPRPQAQQVDEDGTLYINVSLEELRQADGDFIFVWGATDGTDEARADLEANPLWQQLKGVQNEHVYFVDEERWFAPGIMGVHLLLDDILTYVADVEPAEVAPNPFLNMDY